jgi:hypothetical protein
VPLLFGIYAYLLLLFVTLLAAAWINYDGSVVPWKAWAPGLAAGLLAPALWPGLQLVPVWPSWQETLAESTWLLGFLGSLAGCGAGFVAGALTFPISSVRLGKSSRVAWPSIVVALAVVGAFLGWPAVTGIAAITSVAFLATTVAGRVWTPLKRIPWVGLLFLLALVWVLCWRPVFETLTYVQWLEMKAPMYLLVVVLCASALARTWGGAASETGPPATGPRQG